MAFRRLDADLTLDTTSYTAGLRSAAVETRTFSATVVQSGREAQAGYEAAAKGAASLSATVAETARANIAARVKEQQSLTALAAEYRAIAATAAKGSAEQVAAARLVEESNRRLISSAQAVQAANARTASSGTVGAGAQALAGRAGVATVGAGTTGLVVGAVGLGLARAVTEASNLNETVSKSQQVFGAASTQVERFGSTAYRSLGQSKQEAIEATATFGNLLRGIGQTQPEAARMSMALVKLSADLASFNNLQPGDVLLDLRSGLVGEAEPLRKYGVLLNEATVKAKAYEMGLAAVGAELTEQQKVQARYAIILDQTKLAQGDFARTSEGLANQQRIARAGFRDLGGELGGVLLPAARGGVIVFNELNQALKDLPLGGDKGIIDRLYDLTPAGPVISLLSRLGGGHKEAGDAARDQAKAEQEAQIATQAASQAAMAHKKALADLAAEGGLSVAALTAAIGHSGQVGVEAFKSQEEAARKLIAAVNQGVSATSASFMKTMDAVSVFSASSLEAAARASSSAASSIEKDDTRVADSIQRVADLQEQFAEQAAAAREQHAEKVERANERMAQSEQRYADTVEAENRKVADAIQRVQDARDQLEADRASAEQAIRDAEQRAADMAERDAVAFNPAAAAEVARRQEARRAQQDIERARERAAEIERKGLDNIARAEEAAARARVEAARNVAKAESEVEDARAEQLRLAHEGLTVGERTLSQQRQMRDAVAAVGKAQREAAAGAGASTGAVAAAVSVSVDEVKAFYERSLEQGRTFSEGIRTAIARGYDPQFIARLLQQGPREAAPLLAAIAQDQDNTLRNLVNESERAIKEMNFRVREIARITFMATHATTDQLNRDFSEAMAILEANSGEGGRKTAEAIARELGMGVAEVRRIAGEFAIGLAEGINPVLRGIGSVPITYDQEEGRTYAGNLQFAAGGQVPGGYGVADTVDAKLTPGEIVFSVPAMQTLGADNLLALHGKGRRGYAQGGFVTAADVPWPPDLSMYGDKVGYAGTKVDQHAYDSVVAYLNGRGGSAGTIGSATVGSGWQAITRYLDSIGQDYTVTSTVRPGAITSSGNLSNHALGKAVDMVGDMSAIFDVLLNIGSSLSELFFDPKGFSIKNGQRVNWTVGDHDDHVHAATFDRGGVLEPGWNRVYNGTGVREPVVPTATGGGDVVVHVHMNGLAVGTVRQFAESLAEPLRTVLISRNGFNNGTVGLG